MKPSEMIALLDKDIEAMNDQIDYLRGNIANDPGVVLEDLASLEFVEHVKEESQAFDKQLDEDGVSVAEYYSWFEQNHPGKDAMICLDDESYWTPASISAYVNY